MTGYSSFDSESPDEFETDEWETFSGLDKEHDGEQEWDVRIGIKHRCSCGGHGRAELDETEMQGEQDWDVRIGARKHRCSCGGHGRAELGETEARGELPGWV